MEMEDTAGAPCACGQPHLEEVFITAALEDAPAQWGAPPGTHVWRVRAQTPDADGALHVARQVAKALGFDMNPILHDPKQPA